MCKSLLCHIIHIIYIISFSERNNVPIPRHSSSFYHPTLPLPLWNLCPQFPLFLDSSVLIYKPLTFSYLLGVQKPVILWVLSDIIILYSSFILSHITYTISFRHLFAIFSPFIRHLFAIYSPFIRHLFAIYSPFIRHLFAIYSPFIRHLELI